jgi:hypothetical protein
MYIERFENTITYHLDAVNFREVTQHRAALSDPYPNAMLRAFLVRGVYGLSDADFGE